MVSSTDEASACGTSVMGAEFGVLVSRTLGSLFSVRRVSVSRTCVLGGKALTLMMTNRAPSE